MAGFLLFCVYQNLPSFYISVSLSSKIAIVRPATRPAGWVGPVSAAPLGFFCAQKQKTPHLTVRGSSYLMPGSSLLSH
ncbi:hypothetical protein L6R44_24855, partial [Enterobacter cloacae complex sp. ECC445]|uniref:hypothetical protein n=1 Tax=Enterobacter cloacae complex sp. ECC445 TaxID=2913213 RepID=UPI001F448DC7